jgi:hypothetical protein
MKTYWNYRILAKRIDDKEHVEYALYEVHYENDIPVACTINSVSPISFDEDIKLEDSIESIKWQLDAMKLACNKPILDYDNFPNVYHKYYREKKLENINNILNHQHNN